MAPSSYHVVDLREDRSWGLLLEQEVAISLQIIACFSHLCATHNSARDVPSLTSALLMPPKNHFLSRNPEGGFLTGSEHFGDAMGHLSRAGAILDEMAPAGD